MQGQAYWPLVPAEGQLVLLEGHQMDCMLVMISGHQVPLKQKQPSVAMAGSAPVTATKPSLRPY